MIEKQATPDYGYQVEELEHRWIRMSDGVRLSARLWLPTVPEGQPTPAILEYIPYRKRDISRARDERNHRFFARNGYACARVDMRGSGDSEGLMTDMYGKEELDDAIEVIEWIANQPWCNGSVGMMGTSWGGTASLQAAARRPRALKAIIAVCATNNRFDDDIHHMGGCLLTDTIEWAATLPTILASPPDPETVGADWRDMWMQRLEGIGLPVLDWLAHETRDSYWRWGAVNETSGAIECPVLMIGGWTDRYSNTVMNLLAQSHDRCWGIIGPWGHHYPDVGEPGPAIGFQQEAMRWWDYWLRGLETGVEREPALRVWMQHYDSPADRIKTRSGRWVSEPEWPSPSVTDKTLWLHSGLLQTEPPLTHEIASVPVGLEVGIAAGDTGYFGRVGGLSQDQRRDDQYSLVFETEPLKEPLEILGSIRFLVTLQSERPTAQLVVRLNDVAPDGETARVSYAIRNLRLDREGRKIKDADLSEPRAFMVDFPNTAYKFAADHRIRLAISSSYWPIIWPSPRSVQLVLHLSDTSLRLPVRPKNDDDTLVSFEEPLDVEVPAMRMLHSPPLERSISVDQGSGRRSLCWYQPFKCVLFTDIDLEFGFETSANHTISCDDCNSAVSRFEHRLRYRRGRWLVEITGTAELSATETTYNLSASIEARENNEVIFQRSWNPVTTRTCS